MQTLNIAKHTPGPWIAYNGVDIATDREPGKRHLIASVKALETNAVANARLIAAAPELLDALQTVRDYVADAATGGLTYEGSGEGFKAMAKEDLARIDAAISKALGHE